MFSDRILAWHSIISMVSGVGSIYSVSFSFSFSHFQFLCIFYLVCEYGLFSEQCSFSQTCPSCSLLHFIHMQSNEFFWLIYLWLRDDLFTNVWYCCWCSALFCSRWISPHFRLFDYSFMHLCVCGCLFFCLIYFIWTYL